MLQSFKPIVAKEPKILILGSMPSVTSLEKQEYYGFKHNRFWKIMASYFHCEVVNYEEKKQLIMDHNLILWDVIARCHRVGSLDSAIRDEVCNDIASLLNTHPSIALILCNGRKSYDLFQKHNRGCEHIQCICLPSTSNANRSIKESELYASWFTHLDTMFKETQINFEGSKKIF